MNFLTTNGRLDPEVATSLDVCSGTFLDMTNYSTAITANGNKKNFWCGIENWNKAQFCNAFLPFHLHKEQKMLSC